MTHKTRTIKPIDPRLLAQLLVLSCMVAGALLPEMAFASTAVDPKDKVGTALDPAWVSVEGFLTGAGGRIITGVSFLGALIGSVWGFNPKVILGAAGVGVVTALSPAFITATVGCLI